MNAARSAWWAGPDSRRKALVAVAVAATVLAGVYSVAATTATSMAGGFTTAQSENHSRRVEFEAETMRVSAERAAAREKCDRGTRKERLVCRAAARADEESAIFRSAYRREAKP